MIHPKLICLFLVIVTGLFGATEKLEPNEYFTLRAVVAIDGREHPVNFTWHTYEKMVLDASGRHANRYSTAHSVLRVLSDRVAVVMRLPFPYGSLVPFIPSLFLIDPSDTRVFREYRHLTPGGPSVGRVRLVSFAVTSSNKEPAPEPMTRSELRLRDEIEDGEYGTVWALRYPSAVWEKSAPLAERLAAVTALTAFGRRGDMVEDSTASLMNSVMRGPALRERLTHVGIGFEVVAGVWVETPNLDEYAYVKGFASVVAANEAAHRARMRNRKVQKVKVPPVIPIPGRLRGAQGDFERDELWFDPKSKEIVYVAAVSLVPLKRSHWGGSENGNPR